ncbi:MAG: hypothetical protein KDI68_01240 [Gammaproteobacteria bacterium]|nr:hypothetical protein [Gammaproteobacteria bacterium]
MDSGYLYLQTHAAHPGMVRFLIGDRLPAQNPAAPLHLAYVARFNDVQAARMHVQNSLGRRLVDIDEHLYRVDLIDAIATVDADNLSHEEIWIDEALGDAERDAIHARTALLRQRQRRRDAIWDWIGLVALMFLITGVLGIF